MDLVALHHELFGEDSEDTPEALRVTELHRKLYRAFPSVRGASFKGEDSEALPAIIVMAIAQLRPDTQDKAYIYTTKLCEEWVLRGLRLAARRAMRCKEKSVDREAFVRDRFGRVLVGHGFLRIAEPGRWVAIGLSLDAPLPPWLKDKLIEVPRG